jgi:hypothetical protein
VGEPFGHSLTFDSEFECGNLLRAVQRGDASYDLFLRSDLHTEGNTQWFYFAVSNTHPAGVVKLSEQGVQVPPVRVRFNIVNLTKPDSLFNLGMRPVVYSCIDAGSRGVGWLRSGSDISYFGNNHQRNNTSGEGNAQYYTLAFTIEFQHAKDTVLVAYSYPYSVADYRAHISDILHRSGAHHIIRSSRLCTTVGGESCDLLVITNFKDKDKERIGPITVAALESEAASWTSSSVTKKKILLSGSKTVTCSKLKPALFFSGRVHPGETPASWMMKGMLEFLTGDSPQAHLLRQAFVIYIVPILNPDGVIYGNNRCALAGVDLNRQWKAPLKASHPTVFALKNFMFMMKKIREINLYIDLHGHSRKYNVFMYGCDEKKKAKPLVRAFPKFFSSHNVGGKYVSFADCSFHVRKGRESTARVVVSRELNIPLSFTLEATFCGSNYGPYQNSHMNIGHLQEVGASLCDAVLQFFLAENLIKDVLVIPTNLKKKNRDSVVLPPSSDGITLVSNKDIKNLKDLQDDKELKDLKTLKIGRDSIDSRGSDNGVDIDKKGCGYAFKIDRSDKESGLNTDLNTNLLVSDDENKSERNEKKNIQCESESGNSDNVIGGDKERDANLLVGGEDEEEGAELELDKEEEDNESGSDAEGELMRMSSGFQFQHTYTSTYYFNVALTPVTFH